MKSCRQTTGRVVNSGTHHIGLVHLDGHFTDGVCRFVDHFQEAGAAQSLSADCSGQLNTRDETAIITLKKQQIGESTGVSFVILISAYFFSLQELSDVGVLQQRWVIYHPLQIPVRQK